MYEPIVEALRRNATAEALAAAGGLVALHSQDPQAYRWLAVAQQQNAQPEAALASIDRAIELAPEDAGLYMVRAGMLLGSQQVDEAQGALAQAAGLDPNRLGAYVLQAQLALGRGDLEEAARQHNLASRVAPDHPRVAAIEGVLDLHRGAPDSALKTITAALERAPGDLQLRFALGFAYLQKAHWAFAEQAFRSIIEQNPATASLRGLLAHLVRRQGRPDEAFEVLAPLLDNPVTATPLLRRFAGELRLEAGQVEEALPLLMSALGEMPDDAVTLAALIQAWERKGDIEAARNTLDAALATTMQAPNLWSARLALEPLDGAVASSLAARWVAATPDSVAALEAQMISHAASNQAAAAEAVAMRIIELSPGHSSAQLYVYGALLRRDPSAAVAHVQSLLSQARSSDARVELLGWLAMAQDRAGQPADAVASWTSRAEIAAPNQLPLHMVSPSVLEWPPMGEVTAGSPHPVFLWGLPGSGVERVATLLAKIGASLLDDRFHPDAFADGFQQFASIEALVSGSQDRAASVSEWRARLPARGVQDGNPIDWLVWWDNSFLLALRPHLPEGRLLLALRDPRDMLVEWLAFGSASQLVFRSPRVAARWLSDMLEQVAVLKEQELYPHTIVRLDGIETDPQALSAAVGDALGGITLPVPDSLGAPHLASGRWRQYAEALAEPFAILGPVASRLGYPAH